MTRDHPSAAGRPDRAAWAEGLERLRACVGERLDRIEALARARPEAAPVEPSGRERALQKRLALLEEEQQRLQAEARRREQEWEAALTQLDRDRRLLADAWERLERERIIGPAPGHATPPRASSASPTAAPVFRPAPAADGPPDVVAQAILRQFQALRDDVRGQGQGHGHRPRR